MSDTVICLHHEKVESSTDIGTCSLCGQRIQYYFDNPKKPTVLERGYIDGKMTEVHPPRAGAAEKKEPAPEEEVNPGETVLEGGAVLTAEKVKTEPPAATPEIEKEEAIMQTEVPVRPKKRRHWDAYYEENKKAIIADYRSMLLKKFFERWHMSSNTWKELKIKWEVKPKGLYRGSRQRRIEKVEERQAPKAGQLPDFPPFDSGWGDVVQIKWLETYKELKLAGR